MISITKHALLVALALLVPALVFAHGMSDAEKLSIVAGGNLRYLSLAQRVRACANF